MTYTKCPTCDPEKKATEKFTLSLTRDELDWLFDAIFPEAIKSIGGIEEILMRNEWHEQVRAQGYRLGGRDVS